MSFSDHTSCKTNKTAGRIMRKNSPRKGIRDATKKNVIISKSRGKRLCGDNKFNFAKNNNLS
jgi:hypothetical protein